MKIITGKIIVPFMNTAVNFVFICHLTQAINHSVQYIHNNLLTYICGTYTYFVYNTAFKNIWAGKKVKWLYVKSFAKGTKVDMNKTSTHCWKHIGCPLIYLYMLPKNVCTWNEELEKRKMKDPVVILLFFWLRRLSFQLRKCLKLSWGSNLTSWTYYTMP